MLVPRAMGTITQRQLAHLSRHGTNAVLQNLELLDTWPALNFGSQVEEKPATQNLGKANINMGKKGSKKGGKRNY